MSRRPVSYLFGACAEVTCNRFQALLRYLYTDEIKFAPWRSMKGRKARRSGDLSDLYGIPKPSPKSIYRLADKVTIHHVVSANCN